MAIYSFQCKIVARTKRLNNAVAHAAYINRIDLDNNRDKVRAIMDVTRQVKSGRNFLIFPEGGYTDNKNELQEFQAGCFS